jgi:hypothetical protein
MPQMGSELLCGECLRWKIGHMVEADEADGVLVAGRWDVWGAPALRA